MNKKWKKIIFQILLRIKILVDFSLPSLLNIGSFWGPFPFKFLEDLSGTRDIEKKISFL